MLTGCLTKEINLDAYYVFKLNLILTYFKYFFNLIINSINHINSKFTINSNN